MLGGIECKVDFRGDDIAYKVNVKMQLDTIKIGAPQQPGAFVRFHAKKNVFAVGDIRFRDSVLIVVHIPTTFDQHTAQLLLRHTRLYAAPSKAASKNRRIFWETMPSPR
ncbi:hypothetical protein EYF80_010564 [Liparis tanakae]|uniref:Uncharacterized protein n=1 Tax=Liparis tanakae TaxID=230148 RepID=A0A4Z2IMT8_9TELE|nr:hypothetical protein EYF80_010564 [Liparis tanakae]